MEPAAGGLVHLAAQALAGTGVPLGITQVPEYEHHRVRRVTVAAPGIVSYADGERFGELPLTIESAPGALVVMA